MSELELVAKEAGLKYSKDTSPGYLRERRGKGFIYRDEASGEIIHNERILNRIKKLVIPPAWNNVWICKSPNGHLQATGLDKKGRKQYRYHPQWAELRNSQKFDRLLKLGESLNKLKKKIDDDLGLKGLPREKVVAAVIKLMLLTHCRIGNAIYAQDNDSYGLSTLLNEHAEIVGSKIEIRFTGKSGVEHDLTLSDQKLARIIYRCQELPGEELFCYLSDSGEVIDINSSHINDYLRESTGSEFTAKDLRTWGGTCKALEVMMALGPCEQERKESFWKKRHLDVYKETARYLRNTVSVCRKYYVHPLIMEADRGGVLPLLWFKSKSCKYLDRYEKLLLNLLMEFEEIKLKAS